MQQTTNAGSRLKRVVILGHSGFIGTSLVNQLEKAYPEVEVIGLSTPEADLLDPASLEKIGSTFTPETGVVFCSAIKRQSGDSLETFEANMAMVRNCATLLAENPVKRFVMFSSAAVYGEDVPYDIISEQTGVHPVSYYGIGKFTAERIFYKALENQEESSYVFLRPATVYGPGDRGFPYGPSGFSHKAVTGERITLWGDGEELREFVYIDDMADLTCRFLHNDFEGAVNIVAGTSYTFQDVLAEVKANCPDMETPDSRPRSKNKVDNRFDNALLRQLVPGFEFTPLSEGVRLTVESLR